MSTRKATTATRRPTESPELIRHHVHGVSKALYDRLAMAVATLKHQHGIKITLKDATVHGMELALEELTRLPTARIAAIYADTGTNGETINHDMRSVPKVLYDRLALACATLKHRDNVEVTLKDATIRGMSLALEELSKLTPPKIEQTYAHLL